MSTIVLYLKKTVIGLVLAALAALAAAGTAAFPPAGVAASGAQDPSTPPVPGTLTNERLEQIWAREQSIYARIGERLDRADEIISKVQNLIDQAEANGKDASAIQAALDAFAAAIKEVRPLYESAKGILAAHQGFDASGKVTDPGEALQTVKDMRDKFRAMREAMAGTGRALREAIQAFRQANQPAPATP